MRTTLALLLLAATSASAQILPINTVNSRVPVVWQVPFGSAGNTVSLAVRNNSTAEAQMVTVKFIDVPSWLEFKSGTMLLKKIPAESSEDAEFVFSIDKKAPIGKDTTLTAVISMAGGQTWTANMTISVDAPTEYKLYNNFPNPFNPSTKIAFELPRASHVTLTVYDILGREVAEIANRNYPAGYSEVLWNGLNKSGEQVASGVYLYRISAGKWSAVRKMMMIK